MEYIHKDSDEIIILPDSIRHYTFADLNPKSAGFIVVTKDNLRCFGESDSLKLKSRNEDSKLAKDQLFL